MHLFAGILLNEMVVAQLEATLAHIPLIPTALFFFVHATLEIHAAEAGLHDTLDELELIFPGCATIKGMRGLIHYHVRGELQVGHTDFRLHSHVSSLSLL